jgi:hypothetical protein
MDSKQLGLFGVFRFADAGGSAVLEGVGFKMGISK